MFNILHTCRELFLALNHYQTQKRGQRYKFCTIDMTPTKIGQIVKFHTPMPDENPNQLYVILEIFFDVERPRAKVQALGLDFCFPLVSVYWVSDLEIVEIDTADLLGQKATIIQSDNAQTTGYVKNVAKQKIIPDYNLTKNGVETNVMVTIIDNEGVTKSGYLCIT
ncbi:MAG: hypothetical protein JW870_18080 [Candidatus Delongbacteria bacterium]|nr:hypothetical protein [Candidatus Delongbacteria bacterium]